MEPRCPRLGWGLALACGAALLLGRGHAAAAAALDVGLSAGVALPAGELVRGQPLNYSFSALLPLQGGLWYRHTHRWRLGISATYGHGVTPAAVPGPSASMQNTASASVLRLAACVDYHWAPFASVDPWLGGAVGGSWLRSDSTTEGLGLWARRESSRFAPLVSLRGGVQWRLIPGLYLGPYLAASAAQVWSSADQTGTGTFEVTSTAAAVDAGRRALHFWPEAGVALQWSL